MQFLDFSAAVDTVEGVEGELDRLERMRFLSPQQRAAVSAEPIVRFFQSELGRELLTAAHVAREYKFSMLVPALDYDSDAELGEEVLLQGVVDCWFENEDGITVIDFKTDRVTETTVSDRAAHYTPQLAAYSRALSQVLCKPVNRRCLWFFQIGQSVEV
jgi:ATP-dependent helicase/nuclease subunit A